MSYLGSKAASGVYQKIIAEMPLHDTCIETHLGGWVVMLRKPPVMCNIGIDVDELTLVDCANGHNRLYIDLVRADAVDYLNNYDFLPCRPCPDLCRSAVPARNTHWKRALSL